MTHKVDQEPNLTDLPNKNVWREVYNGRWTELAKVQKAEFVIEVLFLVLSFSGFIYYSYSHGSDLLGLATCFVALGAVLGVFFFLLTRYIR